MIEINSILWGNFVGACIFGFGAILGSFTSVLISRSEERRGQWISGRSACPACQAPLKAKDLFPIISWLAQKGKCRFCNIRISVLYPCLEIGTGLALLVFYYFFGLSWDLLFFAIGLPFAVSLLFCLMAKKKIVTDYFILTTIILLGYGIFKFLTDYSL